ncbi:MAG: hypothetical protein C1943_05015 [Halochromatium sp.]|nr:hypothetical protein [Halochromatium sp.]
MLENGRPLASAATLALLSLLIASVPATARADAPALQEQLAVAGLSLPETRSFLTKLKHAVAKDDRKAVAAMSDYPITVAVGADAITLDSPGQFVARYADFMTQALRALIAETTLEDLFANAQGAMLGNGALWFGPVCKQGGKLQNLDACANPPVLLIRINGVQ